MPISHVETLMAEVRSQWRTGWGMPGLPPGSATGERRDRRGRSKTATGTAALDKYRLTL